MTGAARSHLRAAEVHVAPASAGSRTERRAPLAEAERSLAALEARLRALDPERTLARGWSITRGPDGRCSAPRPTSAPGDALTTVAGRRARSALYGVRRCLTTRPEIGYAEALAELEAILEEIEDDAVDVDVLAAR